MISTLMPASGYLNADKAGEVKTIQDKWESMQKSARDFEAYFVGSIFQAAYSSIEKSDLLGGSNSNELYQSLFIEEMTKAGANSPKGFGLADAMLKQVAPRYGVDGEVLESTNKL